MNNTPPRVRLFDGSNNLLEEFTFDETTFPFVGFPNGFVGLNYGSNAITYHYSAGCGLTDRKVIGREPHDG